VVSAHGAKRILVVDDSEVILAAVAAALTQAGYDVTAVDTLDKLHAAERQSFDLVLMDVQMPQLYGDDIAGILRHERKMSGKVYLLSSLPEAELAERAADAGLDGYLAKDAGLDVLVARVAEILAG
jgi:DNA-binding response OmpR family regulator